MLAGTCAHMCHADHIYHSLSFSSELAKCTDHAGLEITIQALRAATDYVNERKRQSEYETELLELERDIQNCPVGNLQGASIHIAHALPLVIRTSPEPQRQQSSSTG